MVIHQAETVNIESMKEVGSRVKTAGSAAMAFLNSWIASDSLSREQEISQVGVRRCGLRIAFDGLLEGLPRRLVLPRSFWQIPKRLYATDDRGSSASTLRKISSAEANSLPCILSSRHGVAHPSTQPGGNCCPREGNDKQRHDRCLS